LSRAGYGATSAEPLGGEGGQWRQADRIGL
jgi:hypothetical protein